MGSASFDGSNGNDKVGRQRNGNKNLRNRRPTAFHRNNCEIIVAATRRSTISFHDHFACVELFAAEYKSNRKRNSTYDIERQQNKSISTV